MTPEKQRIAIAEACGWYTKDGLWFHRTKHPNVEHGQLQPPALAQTGDYLNDLNAMHEAEKMLRPKQRFDYMFNLECVMGFSSGPGGWDMDTESMWAFTNATAAQRAEAFLRTIGKWEDS